MRFLIPALVDSDESERLLNLTVRHIPSVVAATVVVISQGRRLSLEKPSHIRDLIVQHFQAPLPKWAALSRARDALPPDETPCVLLDADDPIEPRSFLDAMAKSCAEPAYCWIGRRDEITLFSEDELSSDSRFFLEMFSDTLLLGTVSLPCDVLLDPPDIQSGFYVLPSSIFRDLSFDYVADYGGELALCYQLWQMGIVTRNLDYSPQPRKASAYRLKQILDQVLNLPFFRNVTDEQIEQALKLAPVRYRRYFDERRLDAFESEMGKILAYATSLGSQRS